MILWLLLFSLWINSYLEGLIAKSNKTILFIYNLLIIDLPINNINHSNISMDNRLSETMTSCFTRQFISKLVFVVLCYGNINTLRSFRNSPVLNIPPFPISCPIKDANMLMLSCFILCWFPEESILLFSFLIIFFISCSDLFWVSLFLS